jgi:hypothetical protein
LASSSLVIKNDNPLLFFITSFKILINFSLYFFFFYKKKKQWGEGRCGHLVKGVAASTWPSLQCGAPPFYLTRVQNYSHFLTFRLYFCLLSQRCIQETVRRHSLFLFLHQCFA